MFNNEVYRNTEGSYTCDCSPGYQRYRNSASEPCEGTESTVIFKGLMWWSSAYVYAPTDIDECVAETDTCSEIETCLNTAGSFICLCNAGFTRSYDESDCEGTYYTMTILMV